MSSEEKAPFCFDKDMGYPGLRSVFANFDVECNLISFTAGVEVGFDRVDDKPNDDMFDLTYHLIKSWLLHWPPEFFRVPVP